MKRSLRSILSLVLSLALLLQPMSIPVFAAETDIPAASVPAAAGEDEASPPNSAPEQPVLDSGAVPPPPPEKTTIVISAFAPLAPDVAVMEIPVGAAWSDIETVLPQTLTATDADGAEILIQNIKWLCDKFQQECAVGDVFTATPVLPQDYSLAENVSLPTIEVRMIENLISPFAINDRIIVDNVIYKEINSTQAVLIGVTKDFPGGAVSMPASVTAADKKDRTVIGIEAEAFKDLATLNSITIGDNVTYLGKQAFSGCKALATVNISASVKEIRERAFENCGALVGITIPDTVETVGAYAFAGAGLTEFTVPAGLKNIGENAFSSSKLTTINFEEGITQITSNYISGSSTLTTINFPASVTSIGSSAFTNCTALISVTIPEGIAEIGSNAFSGCRKLASITIPKSVTTIDSYAFHYCSSLTSIIIPDSVNSISYGVFSGCSSLKSVTLPSNISTIGSSLFSDCRLLETISLPSSVTSIDSYAFYNCSELTGITIPENVESIGPYAFQYCSSLASITIPNSVKSIGPYAFSYCSILKTAILSSKMTSINYNLFYNCSALETVTIPDSITSIGSNTFSNCTTLKSISLPKDLKTIDYGAFSNCQNLSSIVIPNNVTSVGSSAFQGCSNLSSVTLSTDLSILNGELFSGCTSLQQIDIPANITTLSSNIFSGCTKLADLQVFGTLTSVSSNAIGTATATVTVPNVETAERIRDSGVSIDKIKLRDGTDHGMVPTTFTIDGATYTVSAKNEVALTGVAKNLTQLDIPQSVSNSGISYRVTSIRDQAALSCSNLKTVTIPDGVTSIGDSAFNSCTSLESITIPDSVTSIGGYAFASCYSLKSITLPDSVTSIGGYAFRSCSALAAITIPSQVSSIGNSMFSDCTSLKSVTIPDSVTSIGSFAFWNCPSLESIAIPDSVTSIGEYAFYNCSSLKSFVIPSKVATIQNYTFFNCTLLSSVTIPDSVTSIGFEAFYSCTSLSSIAIPGRVNYINSYAFQNCTNLTSITIPSSVSYIYNSAFSGCKSLKSATVLGGLSVNSSSDIFSGCTSLESLTIGGNATGVPAKAFQGFTSLKKLTLGNKVEKIGDYAFAGTSIVNVDIPDSTTFIGERAFDGCTDLGYANIGSGIQTIGIRAFPLSTQLIANDPRVQLLLVKYLSQDEDKRPSVSWDGKSSVVTDAIAAVDKEITISGNVSVAKGAQLSIFQTVIVTGSLTVDGSVTIGAGGSIIVTGSGKLIDNGANDLKIHYSIDAPEFSGGSVIADKTYAAAGETITLTVTPENTFRLKKGSLQYNNSPVTEKNGVYTFVMPAAVVTIAAQFESAYISSVTISANGNTTLGTGDSVTLSAQAVPNDTDIEEITYSWSASDPDAVELTGADSASVTVKAKTLRKDTVVTLTVLAKQGNVTRAARLDLTVLHEKVKSIYVLPEKLTINQGVRQRFTVQITPAGTGSALTWYSSNPGAATVDKDGVVTTVHLGRTEIYAYADGVRSNTVVVETVEQVIYAKDLILSPNPVTLAGGEEIDMRAGFYPLNATVRGKWSSSNPAVATVDESGHVKAISKGTAVLTCTIPKSATENLVRQVTVGVSSVLVGEVSINEKPAQNFRPGATFELTASVKPAQASNKAVEWSSSNPAVATVSQQGLVTFCGAGDATITATSTSNPLKFDSARFSVVVDASGTLSFPDGSSAAYKTLKVTKNGGEPFSIYTDSDSKFRCPALGIGSYLITSSPNVPGYRTLNASFTIEEGSKNPVWELAYQKSQTGTISVSFLDTVSKPVAGVRAIVQCEAPYQYKAGYSDGEGKVQFEGLVFDDKGTEFVINYSTEDGAYGTQTVTLKDSYGTKQVNVTLPSMTNISGKILDNSGAGVPGVYVQVGNRGAYTGNDGSYSIRGQLEPGKYTVALASWEKYFATTKTEINVTAGDSIVVPNITVVNGISVSGRFLLDGQTGSYQKAYILLQRDDGTFIGGSYASGSDGYVFESAVKETGTYKLTVSNVYDKDGNNFLDYEAQSQTFTVSSMSQDKVVLDLEANTKLKTSKIFSGENNVLASNVQLVQVGGKFEIHGKYRNNSNQTVTATFQTSLQDCTIDPAHSGTAYGQTTHIVTLKPGEAGRFLIKALANKNAATVSARTTVTVNGETHDFARITLDVVNVSLSVRSTNIAVGESFQVFGEATLGSKVLIYNQGGKLLGSTQVTPATGRWYAIELKGFPQEGTYTIYANCDAGKEVATSEKIEMHVSSAPVNIQRVTVDQLVYTDLPVNSRTGVRTFSHMVDNSLVPHPLDVRTTFTNDAQVSSVTYHFAGLNFPAERDSNGSWHAGINDWRGTGIKPLSATVKMLDGKQNDFLIAEVVVLIDPSGYVTDADTGNPLAGATATCYVKNSDNSYSTWDSARYSQPSNPLLTDSRGYYGWGVPDGTYRISVAKLGYETGDSKDIDRYRNGIEVPPPALDVDFALVPTTPMSITSLTTATGKINVRLSRYVKDADITVTDPSGKTVKTALSIDKDRITISGRFIRNTDYTVHFQSVTSKSGTSPEYQISSMDMPVSFGSNGANPDDPDEPNQPDNPNQPDEPSGDGSDEPPVYVTGSDSGSSGGYSSAFSSWMFPMDLSISRIQNAPRTAGYATINITGSDKKTTGKQFANALAVLKPGEKMILRQIGKNLRTEYQFVVNPLTLTTLPETLNFGVTLRDMKDRVPHEKAFRGDFEVITLNHNGNFGFTADLALDLDLSKWSSKNLSAYAYNAKTKQYTYLPNAKPRIDTKGFVHLNVSTGSVIVLTNTPPVNK